jgi:hypothetical protein
MHQAETLHHPNRITSSKMPESLPLKTQSAQWVETMKPLNVCAACVQNTYNHHEPEPNYGSGDFTAIG